MTKKQNYFKFKDGKPVGAIIYSYEETITKKRFKLRLSKLGNGMITDTQKRKDLFFDKEFLDATLPTVTEWLNELTEENEQLKQQLRHLEYRFVEYRNKEMIK